MPASVRVESPPLVVAAYGHALLADRLLNKDTAFTEEERDAFQLRGLLPAQVLSIDEQVALELEHVRRKSDDLERYIGLGALHDRNETLFTRLLRENLEELMPIVYTPTVGRACQEFSHIFRRPRGLWLSPDDVDRLPRLLEDATPGEVRLVVATDNERILGLGDQGAGGMGIPVGKLAIYTAVAGLHPLSTLPISLDVGTDHPSLLDDPLYAGYRARRLRGPAYDAFIERFVGALQQVYPRAILQWEDFKGPNALRLLARYRHRIPSFNDDIQGTGATAVAGILAATRIIGLPLSQLRVLIVGAGAAGIGIGRALRFAGSDSGGGMHGAGGGEPSIAMVDREGLIHDGRSVSAEKAEFALAASTIPTELLAAGANAKLAAIIDHWRPQVLIGVTAVKDRFDEPTIRAMARVTERPVVMALSNPITACEATPIDIAAWSDGRALVATGSPFDPVTFGGVTRPVGQGNNAFIFPGLGLGAIVAEARSVTDGMLRAAAYALADAVTPDRLASGVLYPPIADLPGIARAIAGAVIREARDSGYGRDITDGEIAEAVDAAIWEPAYVPYRPGGTGLGS